MNALHLKEDQTPKGVPTESCAAIDLARQAEERVLETPETPQAPQIPETLETPEPSELVFFSRFFVEFEGRLSRWDGAPKQVQLEDGRIFQLVPFEYKEHDKIKDFYAVAEDNFWKDPLKFFDQEEYPKGIVVGVYKDASKRSRRDGFPKKKVVFIPSC